MSNRFLLSVAGLVLVATVLALSHGSQSQEPSTELGLHLVTITACNDCHTPFKLGPRGPEPDTSRLLSGHPAGLVIEAPPVFSEGPWLWAGATTNTAYAGPWGISYAANLTPDDDTGMGIWTEEMFVKAMRDGRHMGQSRPIQPPMPWQAYSAMTDHELRSVYAYLRTVPAIDNLVPDYRPPVESGPGSASWTAP